MGCGEPLSQADNRGRIKPAGQLRPHAIRVCEPETDGFREKVPAGFWSLFQGRGSVRRLDGCGRPVLLERRPRAVEQ